MNKNGSIGEWIVIFLIMLSIGVLVLFISTEQTYTKAEVDDRLSKLNETLNSKSNKPACKLLEIDFQKDAGKNDFEICSNIGKEPLLIIISKDITHYKGPTGSIMITNFCSVERLVFSHSITETTISNIGTSISRPYGGEDCSVKDPLNGVAEKIKTTEIDILCC